jgi:hypothetical protein
MLGGSAARDSDGLADTAEGGLGTMVLVADMDGDGLLDGEEVNTHSTDPIDRDSDDDDDDDEIEDGDEVLSGTNPDDPLSFPVGVMVPSLGGFGLSLLGMMLLVLGVRRSSRA